MRRGCENRQRILAIVDSDPGIHVRELVRVTGLTWGTCHYHVTRLEEERSVVVRHVRGRSCLFGRARSGPSRAAAALLRGPRNRRLARVLLERPGTVQGELQQATGMPASVLCRRIRRFEEAGLVQRIREGRCLIVTATPELEAAMRRRSTALDIVGAGASPLATVEVAAA